MAGELVRSNVSVLVTTDTAAAHAAKRATTTVPIVFVGLADPVGSGLVESLARPGANVTGGSSAFEDGIGGKWVELLREVRPVAKIGLVWNPANALLATAQRIAQIEGAAAGFGIKVLRLAISRPEDLDAFTDALARTKVEGLIVDPDVTLIRYNARVRQVAGTHRLPIVSAWRPDAERVGGSLLAYGPSLPGIFRLAAVYVDKIARGANPASLPVEQESKYDLVINLKTAKALGLTIPPSLLQRADHVIE
jgi:putative ABC transport system substrate-binding protein